MSPELREYMQDLKNETRGKIKRWELRKKETMTCLETNCTDTF